MAGILGASSALVFWVSMGCIAGGGAPAIAAGPGLDCPGSLAAPALAEAYPSVHAAVVAGPFYDALVSRNGAPVSCSRWANEGVIHIDYRFEHGGALVAKVDPSIEYSEQRLSLLGLKESEATTLLKAAEKAAFDKEGCSIAWKSPETAEGTEAGTTEIVYRGDVCNCQARAIHRGKVLTGLLFRSAC